MADGAATYVLDMGEPVRIVDLVQNFARLLERPDRRLPVHRAAARARSSTRSCSATGRSAVPTAHSRISMARPPMPARASGPACSDLYDAAAPQPARRGASSTSPTWCPSTAPAPGAHLPSPAPASTPTTTERARPAHDDSNDDHPIRPRPRRQPVPPRRCSTTQPRCRQTVTRSRRWVVASGARTWPRHRSCCRTSTTSRKMELPSSVAVATSGDGPARPDRLLGQLRHGADRGGQRGARRPRPWSGSCGRCASATPTRPAAPRSSASARSSGGRRARRGVRASTAGAHPAEDLERIEEGGRLDLEPYGGIDRLDAELPGAGLVQLARFRFGTVGPVQPLRGAAARRGGPRPRARRAARGPRGPADHPVPRRRRRPDRRARSAVLPAQGLPAPDQGGEPRAQAVVPPALGPVLAAAA